MSERNDIEIAVLNQISHAIVHELNVSELLNNILNILRKEMGLIRGTITLKHEDTLVIEASNGLTDEEISRGKYMIGEGVTGKVAQTGKPALIPDISQEPEFLGRTQARAKNEHVAFICVPIVHLDNVIGTLSIDCSGRNREELERDLRLLDTVANIMAEAVASCLRKYDERALGVFQRIYLSVQDAQGQLDETKSVVQSETKSDWKFLLQPGIFKAVLIGAAIAILGQFMGVNAVLYYGPSIFEEAGLSGGDALFSQVLVGLVNAVTTVIAVFIIDKVGRKKLVYYGVSGMVLSLLLIGFYFRFSASLGLPNSFLLFFFLFYVFCCAISISAVIFVLLSEMYPIRIRGMAMSIAGFALWVGTYLVGQLTPWMLQNLTPAGTFLLFAIMCVPYMLIVWKLIPETTGKSLEEIERYWMKK